MLPLGDLIYLDRERCIQCARCIRFQHEVVDDPVIGFHNRGRKLEIVTFSEPGFDSKFSGNTTDICPVGALTTADFRFGARPWELKNAASVCSQCPVGCNLTFNVRREAKSAGAYVIKRVMPRQNEQVNEIWICDKGRFAYHYASRDRRPSVPSPLVRKNGELVPPAGMRRWPAAAESCAGRQTDGWPWPAGGSPTKTCSTSNSWRRAWAARPYLYTEHGRRRMVALMAWAQRHQPGRPGQRRRRSWWWPAICTKKRRSGGCASNRRPKRGATLIVANARATKLDEFASPYRALCLRRSRAVLRRLWPERRWLKPRSAPPSLPSRQCLVVFFGSEGMGLEGTQALAEACAALLQAGGHTGRANNGLVGVWPKPTTRAPGNWASARRQPGAAAAGRPRPATSPPPTRLAMTRPWPLRWIRGAAAFVVVQDLFLTETAKLADVVFPVQSFIEREGTFTSGERRVQRFYPAVPAHHGAPGPIIAIAAQLGQRLGRLELEGRAAGAGDEAHRCGAPAFNRPVTIPQAGRNRSRTVADDGPQRPVSTAAPAMKTPGAGRAAGSGCQTRQAHLAHGGSSPCLTCQWAGCWWCR